MKVQIQAQEAVIGVRVQANVSLKISNAHQVVDPVAVAPKVDLEKHVVFQQYAQPVELIRHAKADLHAKIVHVKMLTQVEQKRIMEKNAEAIVNARVIIVQ